MKFYFKLFASIFLIFLIDLIAIPQTTTAVQFSVIVDRGSRSSSSSSSSYRSNFKYCCALGKQHANSTNSCSDYSSLKDTSNGCAYAYTICCNQNRRVNECERGKKHAYAGLPCADLKQKTECDTLVDCCHCCELGIQTRKSGEDCTTNPEFNNECNALFLDCCKYATTYEDCSNSHFCPSGQICENTASGPICKCPDGFEKDSYTKKHCIDIDECRRPNICPTGYTCQNTVGSYACTRTCGIGYYFDANANQCKDVDECVMDTHNCLTGMRCENYPGSFRCIREKPCGTGYSVNVFTQDCEDIDECSTGRHDCGRGYICINYPGRFRCKPRECGHGYIFNYNIGDCEMLKCKDGYEIDSSGKCADINECEKDRNICQANERCDNMQGSYKCVLVLICEEGTELSADKSECVDIDECQIGRHTCPANAECVNTLRSYKCVCPQGYRLDEHRNICEDVDECAFGSVCPTNAFCRNTPGSFHCECRQGFTLVSHNFQSCVDVDECKTPNLCAHRCINTYGSYQCVCDEGFKLASDRRTCVDINECELQPNLCPGTCTNTPGSYECRCPTGFTLDKRYRRVCEDVNECDLRQHNCSSRDSCVNTKGSFRCLTIDCPKGYSRVNDGRNPRCERVDVVCENADLECFRRPMKIFYSYTSFSYMVPVPVRIFTTRVSSNSRRIKYKYELKLIHTDGHILRDDQFTVKQVDPTTFEVYLNEACISPDNIQLDLKIEFYKENSFTSCLLNKIFVYVTD